mmetsp:Transcript_4149/g.8628  ORF Transcript_4149/g.8628 Transcript_4149/m.8628 type:complete len:90 (+) Transcript_4149:484-753(+)
MQPPSCTKHQPQIRTLFPHASPVFNLSFCRDVVSWAFRKLNTLPCVDLRIIIFRRKKENGLNSASSRTHLISDRGIFLLQARFRRNNIV